MVHRTRSKKSIRTSLLASLLVLEVVVAVFAWRTWMPTPRQGFIIKNGPSYVLAWKNDDATVDLRRFETVQGAIGFANETLSLSVGTYSGVQDALESIWLRRDMGKVTLYWKTFRFSFLNRLTFQDEEEAKIFESAFRKGAYSTSPMGHSISLVKITR